MPSIGSLGAFVHYGSAECIFSSTFKTVSPFMYESGEMLEAVHAGGRVVDQVCEKIRSCYVLVLCQCWLFELHHLEEYALQIPAKTSGNCNLDILASSCLLCSFNYQFHSGVPCP